MKGAHTAKATGYDKYIDWRVFIFPVAMLAVMLATPPLNGMKDVGTEYALGEKAALDHLARQIFEKPVSRISGDKRGHVPCE